MARKQSQLLVIDASVARAAGPEDAVHPTAKHCRDFLLIVLDVCHRAVFSPPITDEWKQHQSGFARQWRVAMFARKKIESLDDPKDHKLRQQVENAAANEKQQDVMLKDIHLIEAALAKGRRIVSLDETVRGYFHAASGSISSLHRICWINPDNQEDHPLEWLRDGAPAAAFRMLSHEPGKA